MQFLFYHISCTDFARLIQKHLQEQTPSSQTSTGESFSSANSSVLPSGQGMH